MSLRRTTAVAVMLLLAFAMAAHAADGPVRSGSARPAVRVIDAGPADYLAKLAALKAGDTLRLAPGIYEGARGAPGLPVYGLHGTAELPITITGPEAGKAVFLGVREHNTVRIANSSHVVLRNFEIDGRDLGGDGVNGQGPSHHMTLDGLTIRGVGDEQGTVGISTNRAPAWNWTIRRCTITGAGTGMYLGHSDGRHPFVAGVIEHNLVRDTRGYNVQIKHQRPWASGIGAPTTPTRTVIRHNVFVKQANASRGTMARPNLLVGDVPASGPGSANGYEIYGNYFFQNPTEALFQGEGNIAFYANLLVNDAGPGVVIQPHNGRVRDVHVFGNTIVTAGTGISIAASDALDERMAVANLVYAATPIVAAHQEANFVAHHEQASRDLVRAKDDDGNIDLRARPGVAAGPVLDMHELASFTDSDRDFDGRVRDWRLRGAYATDATRPARWRTRLAIKPER